MMAGVARQEVPWPMAEVVHRQTEGNPLFVQEMLRYLVEEGLVERREGSLRRVGEETLVGRIPEGLRDVIGKRLSRLSEQTNQALAMASVIGREFRLDVLQRVAGLPDEALEAALAEAMDVSIVEERASAGAVVTYRFTHAFFRQTLYEETIAPRRIRLHQQVARALEAVYGRRLEEHAAELAEHYAYSSNQADLAKAVAYGELAAQRAMGVYAYGEAVRHLEQALKVQEVLDPDDKAKRCDLLLALGEALGPGGQPRRIYEDIAERAFVLAEQLADAGRSVRAARMGNVAMRRFGGIVTAATPGFRVWTERCVRYAPVDTHDRAYAEMVQALRLWAVGEFSESWLGLSLLLEHDRRRGDPDSVATVIYGRLGVGGGPQHLREQLEMAEEFTALPAGDVNPRVYALGLLFCGHLQLACGHRDKADQLWRSLSDLAVGSHDANLLFLPRAAEISRLTFDGHLEEGLEAAGRLVVQAEESGSPVSGRHFATCAAFRPLLYLGRPGDALKDLDGLREAAEIQPDQELPDLRARRALCLAYLGRREEADALLHQLMGMWLVGANASAVPTGLRLLLLETALLEGDRDAVSTLASGLVVASSLVAVQTSGISDQVSVARLLGAAATALGEKEQALRFCEEAVHLCSSLEFRPDLALAHLQIAELMLEEAGAINRARTPGVASGSPLSPGGECHSEGETRAPANAHAGGKVRAQAIEHLDFAIAEFREMKMQPSLERALRHKEVLKA